MERDSTAALRASPFLHFNSHAHVERDSSLVTEYLFSSHFNSHAHVERDRAALRASLAFSISTHTLTWSVTIDINVGAP